MVLEGFLRVQIITHESTEGTIYRTSCGDIVFLAYNVVFATVSSVFGEKLDDVLVGAANSAMDYIAYVDETWVPENDEDREKTLDMERLHFESLKAVLQMAE